MLRIGVIILGIVIVFMMLRYRQDPKVQKWSVIGLVSLLLIYIFSILAFELFR